MRKLLAVLVLAFSLICTGCTVDQWKFDPANPVSISNNAVLVNVISYSATYGMLVKAKATSMDVASLEGVLIKVKEAVDTCEPDKILGAVDLIIAEIPVFGEENKSLISAIVLKVVREGLAMTSVNNIPVENNEWIIAVRDVVSASLTGATEACHVYRVQNLIPSVQV